MMRHRERRRCDKGAVFAPFGQRRHGVHHRVQQAQPGGSARQAVGQLNELNRARVPLRVERVTKPVELLA